MKKTVCAALIAASLCLLGYAPLPAQSIPDWRARIHLSDSGYVDLLQYFQVWNTVTLKSPRTSATPRLDTHIRRARVGLGGQINAKSLFYVGFTYDGIGKDSLSVSAGSPNPNDNQTFSIRDAFFTYKFSGLLNVTIGYFRPRAGKESIYTSAFNISQEKGQPNFYPRVHMVGRSIGRETGINIGGFKRGDKHSFLYDVGMFDPNHPLIRGDNSVWSPLLTARTVWMIGDPEFAAYQLVYSQSGFMERKGLSLGVNATYQRQTSLFRDNMVYGADAQLNYGPLDLLAEYLWLYRASAVGGNAYQSTTDNSYVVKGAWNIALPHAQILQFCLMRTATRPDKRFRAEAINPLTRAALHEEWAVGFNWMVKRNRLKLGLHYVDGRQHYLDANERNSSGIFRYFNPSLQWMM
ncbi:MAG: porin [Saprospiraceae bacterium]